MEQSNPFGICEDEAEIILAVERMLGLSAVEKLLSEIAPTSTRQSLRRAADRLAAVGLAELASLIRKYARRAKPGPPTFEQRWPRPRGQKTLANMRARGYRDL
jgi:hypothetical protein